MTLMERPEERSSAPDGVRKVPVPAAAPAPAIAPWRYALTAVLGGSGAGKGLFRDEIRGLAAGPGDRIHVLEGGEVKVLGPAGDLEKRWRVFPEAACLAVSPDGRVLVGGPGRVEVFDSAGNRAGGFAVGEPGKPAEVTAIKVRGDRILVADASARRIRVLDASGKETGEIGKRSKAGGFILPNKCLDFDVDPSGIVRAADTGRHQVTAWSLDGEPRGSFGKFGMKSPEDFVGCCNPVNVAATPEGKIVTGEKAVARVKVFEPDGRLLAYIGPENFDQGLTHIPLAVDSKGRILAADPVRREIKVFARQDGAREGGAASKERDS